jgi:trk system potassium uptake protein TrkH
VAKKILAHFSPGRTLLLSLFLTIVLGALGLALPQARTVPIAPIDLFFTATSATCVTGLFTIPLDHFTWLGKIIILILIQIGGIGLITMSLCFISLFVNLGLSTQLMAIQILELESWKNVKKLLIFIIATTFAVELAGAALIMGVLYGSGHLHAAVEAAPAYPCFAHALFHALFHAVSSFCNAGIALPYGVLTLHSNLILIITTLLMFIGGIGFITWHEIVRYLQTVRSNNITGSSARHRFSLHSKIILSGTLSVFTITATLLWLLERGNIFANMSITDTITHICFYAISLKSAGFLLAPPLSLHMATLLLIMVISFIGSAPGSTGSGVKITTVSIFFATIRSVLLGTTAVEIRGRQLPLDQVFKAITIIALSSCWIIITTFCLLIIEQDISFFDLLFESFTAFTTLGLSTGITAQLSAASKMFIIASMLIGRIGSLSFILALKLKSPVKARAFSYPEERVMLG